MTAMLHAIVSDIADELRRFAAAELRRSPMTTTIASWSPSLTAARLLDMPPMIELLLRRADEEQIITAVKARSGRRDGRLLQALVSDDNDSDFRRGDGADPGARPAP